MKHQTRMESSGNLFDKSEWYALLTEYLLKEINSKLDLSRQTYRQKTAFWGIFQFTLRLAKMRGQKLYNIYLEIQKVLLIVLTTISVSQESQWHFGVLITFCHLTIYSKFRKQLCTFFIFINSTFLQFLFYCISDDVIKIAGSR